MSEAALLPVERLERRPLGATIWFVRDLLGGAD
jgi:hypothetical protein